MRYFSRFAHAFPDQRNELLALHHADDAVLVEAVVRGTHLGRLGGLPPTGRSFELPILAIFPFEEKAGLRAGLFRRPRCCASSAIRSRLTRRSPEPWSATP